MKTDPTPRNMAYVFGWFWTVLGIATYLMADPAPPRWVTGLVAAVAGVYLVTRFGRDREPDDKPNITVTLDGRDIARELERRKRAS